jgi:hypothetical protein
LVAPSLRTDVSLVGSVDVIESSRRHGEFDGRWPTVPKLVERAWVPESVDGDQLDWSAFLGRFFPNRRRHDRAALAAYEAYKHWLALREEAA